MPRYVGIYPNNKIIFYDAYLEPAMAERLLGQCGFENTDPKNPTYAFIPLMRYDREVVSGVHFFCDMENPKIQANHAKVIDLINTVITDAKATVDKGKYPVVGVTP